MLGIKSSKYVAISMRNLPKQKTVIENKKPLRVKGKVAQTNRSTNILRNSRTNAATYKKQYQLQDLTYSRVTAMIV